jgi:hypothetical protein
MNTSTRLINSLGSIRYIISGPCHHPTKATPSPRLTRSTLGTPGRIDSRVTKADSRRLSMVTAVTRQSRLLALVDAAIEDAPAPAPTPPRVAPANEAMTKETRAPSLASTITTSNGRKVSLPLPFKVTKPNASTSTSTNGGKVARTRSSPGRDANSIRT